MTMTSPNIAKIKLHSPNVNPSKLWQLVKLGESQLHQVLWHTRAYGTIFGVMWLTLGSLIFVGLDWSCRRLFVTDTILEPNPKEEGE
jgi:hypothetical protein